jgi:predicted GIY-YIG superfamily endonuclease
VPGTVYLLHFDEPYMHARHYVGWAKHLEARLAHHRRGTGANLLRVLNEHGIGWQLARTWSNVDRFFERRVKNHSATRYCPICRGEVAYRSLPEGNL